MMVSRVDMKILDSPASTILVTNSEGARYDINGSFCFVSEIDTPPEESAAERRADSSAAHGGYEGLGSLGNRVTTTEPGEGRDAVELPECSRQRPQQGGKPQSSLTSREMQVAYRPSASEKVKQYQLDGAFPDRTSVPA